MRAGPGPSVHFQVAGEVIPQPHVGGEKLLPDIYNTLLPHLHWLSNGKVDHRTVLSNITARLLFGMN